MPQAVLCASMLADEFPQGLHHPACAYLEFRNAVSWRDGAVFDALTQRAGNLRREAGEFHDWFDRCTLCLSRSIRSGDGALGFPITDWLHAFGNA